MRTIASDGDDANSAVDISSLVRWFADTAGTIRFRHTMSTPAPARLWSFQTRAMLGCGAIPVRRAVSTPMTAKEPQIRQGGKPVPFPNKALLQAASAATSSSSENCVFGFTAQPVITRTILRQRLGLHQFTSKIIDVRDAPAPGRAEAQRTSDETVLPSANETMRKSSQ